ncbi:MAG: response regulator [Propionibacteriaceae bacterium]|nr:response regulator [Propionibacteriaceae bacterium]
MPLPPASGDPASSSRRDPSTPWWAGLERRGEMGRRFVEFDWAGTELGPLDAWPLELRVAVDLCLGTLFPTSLRVGDTLRMVYNDACREVYGEARFQDALGQPAADVWPETTAQVGDLIATVKETGRPYFFSDRPLYLNRVVDSEECYFTLCFSALDAEDGSVLAVVATFVETTRQVLAERRLSTLARVGRAVSQSGTEAELARAALPVLAENAADHPSGALYRAPRASAARAAPLAEFGRVEDAAAVLTLVEHCRSAAAVQHDGTLHAFPIIAPEQESPSHVLVLRHNDARPWDAELDTYFGLLATTIGAALIDQGELWAERRQVARAAALDAAKSAFFAGVNHELRTPLSLISAPVEALSERRGELPPDVVRHVDLVRSNAARLARMVDAMLDFSRMEAGRLLPDLDSVTVSEQIRTLATAFAPAVEQAGLRFVVDVPELSRAALVDADFLERIVLNLLSNAVKFTATGTVELRLVEDGDRYQIAVTDTGPGIDAEDHERIFSRFERIAPPAGARAPWGAGIGLAMVRQLTGLLGGTVTLRSAPGEGSTFTVRLPFVPPLDPGTRGQSVTPRRVESFLAELERPAEPATGEDDGRPRLLIVEDDGQMASFLADSLADSYRVEIATDGESGLAVLRERRPDIVLSDVAMPGMDGVELVRRVRADPALRDLPVLLLSAHSDDHSSASGLDSGADDYIGKPFTIVDVRARLAAHLSRARERSLDADWRRAALSGIRDGVLVLDSDGLVIEMNQAFTDLVGYSMDDGPLRPPYPWWPTEQEDPEALAELRRALAELADGVQGSGEFRIYRRDRRPLWVWIGGGRVRHQQSGLTAAVRTVRAIDRERAARERRLAAAQVSADFSSADDLDTLLGAAEHGFSVLFDGGSTVRLKLNGKELLISGGLQVTAENLPEQVSTGLAGEPSADATSLRPGILLVPRSAETDCRAWIQFPSPRRIWPDEMIVADLLAQAFALAVDRVVAAETAADRETNLEHAVESQRLVGQAVGILIERHRISPNEAFQLLRSASQNRNLKLREVASRVIETGLEPDDA